MSADPWQAVAVHPEDDVAVLLDAVTAGAILRVRVGDGLETLTAAQAIPMGHKIARRGIAMRAPVRKYGEVIGEATTAIAAGDHVHVHNLRSRRARAGTEPPP